MGAADQGGSDTAPRPQAREKEAVRVTKETKDPKEAKMMKVIADAAGITPGQARAQYGQAWRDHQVMIADLVKQGYPPEVEVLLPFYWVFKPWTPWLVLGGEYGTDPSKAVECESRAEAESEAKLYARLDQETVKSMRPDEFTREMLAELRERLSGQD